MIDSSPNMFKLTVAAVAVLAVARTPSLCSSESTASSPYLQSYDFDFMAEPTLEQVLQGRWQS